MKFLTLFILLLSIAVSKAGPAEHGPAAADEDENDDGGDVHALYEYAIDFAQKLALTIMPSKGPNRGDVAVIQPFTLFPTIFPRRLYEEAKEVQLAYLLLYFRISNDFDFLIENYEIAAKTNAHVKSYLDILKTIKAEGIQQQKMLLIGRSDYMCHVVADDQADEGQRYELKQIEFNTGQIGGVHIAGLLTQLHRRIMQKAGFQPSMRQLPYNGGDIVIAEALHLAWQAFGDPKAIFLFVASRLSRNRFGQRHIEYLLEEVSRNKMKIIRISLPGCAHAMKAGELVLDAQDRTLRLYGQKVAVTYIATESPMPSADEWAVRLLFERSTAIKSPTIGQDLANQKKVQQLLSKPGMLERFLPEPENAKNVDAIRRTFAGLWALHETDEQTQKAIKDAIEHPQNYVIKPNREGGGNNIWGEKLKEKLLSFTPEERHAHILMEKLNPMVVRNFIVRPLRGLEYGKMTTELGIIGYLFGNGNDLSVTKTVQKGHMLRTKMAHIDEGGVSFGTGAWDIPLFV